MPLNRVALIYTRVSTGQQAEEGVSLDTQEAQCRFLASERMGLPVEGVFREEGVSGGLAPAERPAFGQLFLRKAELESKGCQVVVVTYDLSRVSRSVADLLELVDVSRGGVLLSTVQDNFDTSTPSGELMRTMLAAINEFNRKMTGQRTKDALAYVKAKFVESGGKEGKQLGQRRVDQITRPETIQAIYQAMHKDRLSQNRTVQRLNDLGLPKPKGKGAWSLDALQRILKAMQGGRFNLETGLPVAPRPSPVLEPCSSA